MENGCDTNAVPLRICRRVRGEPPGAAHQTVRGLLSFLQACSPVWTPTACTMLARLAGAPACFNVLSKQRYGPPRV